MVHLMATQGEFGQSGSQQTEMGSDVLDLVETEMAVLARTLESLHRRSEIYRDLDRASYLIARTLETAGPISINGLASTLGLDPTTVTRQIATMETRRLVLRRTDGSDGRVRLVRLSEEGRRRMRAVQDTRKEHLARLLSDWSENDKGELGRLLARFNSGLSRELAREVSGDAAQTQ
jgi:DNA-binding MarR family transcriptional regulator